MPVEIHKKPKEIVRLVITDASKKSKSVNIPFSGCTPEEVIDKVREVVAANGSKKLPEGFDPLTGPDVPRVYASARHYPSRPGSITITLYGFTPVELSELLSVAI